MQWIAWPSSAQATPAAWAVRLWSCARTYLTFPGHRTFDCIAFPSGFLPPTFIKQKWRSRLYSYGLLTRFYARMMHMYRFISDYHVMQVKHVHRCLSLHSPPLSRETLRDQFLALRDRFWPCKIDFWPCEIVFGIYITPTYVSICGHRWTDAILKIVVLIVSIAILYLKAADFKKISWFSSYHENQILFHYKSLLFSFQFILQIIGTPQALPERHHVYLCIKARRWRRRRWWSGARQERRRRSSRRAWRRLYSSRLRRCWSRFRETPRAFHQPWLLAGE